MSPAPRPSPSSAPGHPDADPPASPPPGSTPPPEVPGCPATRATPCAARSPGDPGSKLPTPLAPWHSTASECHLTTLTDRRENPDQSRLAYRARNGGHLPAHPLTHRPKVPWVPHRRLQAHPL